MIIDVHVHTCALNPAHGATSQRLLNSLAFRFMRWRLGIKRLDYSVDEHLEHALRQTILGTRKLDAAVILAFDAVHTSDGRLDAGNTHFYVKNDYAAELCQRNPRTMLFGCSVHPYRKDALAELQRCIARGAVLMKWLPLTQCFNPADPRCFPLYEALAHHGVPLLSHTGGENALPTLDPTVDDPMLLLPALERGVTVIAAHCGTRASPWGKDHLPAFLRLAREHERFYGDTSALNLPTRSYAYGPILSDPRVRAKLVHGSDWPIYPMPPGSLIGYAEAFELCRELNWMKRDIQCKEALGFDEAYWTRAAKILRLPQMDAVTA